MQIGPRPTAGRGRRRQPRFARLDRLRFERRLVAADGDTSGARLKVSFLPAWLQWLPVGCGDYWVVMLGPQYRYSVVSGPSRNDVWILSRMPMLERTAYDGVFSELKRKGYPVENLVRTAQRPDVTSAAC